MIVSHKHRFVFVGPMKCAARSLHHWFSQPELFGDNGTDSRYALAEDGRRITNIHYDIIPAFLRDAGYRVIVSYRPPVERLLSMWRHLMADCQYARGWMRDDVVRFEHFAAWRQYMPAHLVADPEAVLVQADIVLRLPRLAEDVAGLDFGEDALEPLRQINSTEWGRDVTTDEILISVIRTRKAGGHRVRLWTPELERAPPRCRTFADKQPAIEADIRRQMSRGEELRCSRN